MSDMLVKLYDLPKTEAIVQRLEKKGIVIRRALSCETYPVVHWVKDSFGLPWANECSVAFRNQPVTCFTATQAEHIIGFACYESTCKNFFGPTGVAQEKRGLEIGKALLLSCLHAMAAAGYAYAIIGGVGPCGVLCQNGRSNPDRGIITGDLSRHSPSPAIWEVKNI